MNVLIIYPNSQGLAYSGNEVSQIINTLQDSILLSGHITHSDIMLQARNLYDIVWVIGHMDENGILLSDGYLSTQDFIQYFRRNKPKLIVLNVCQSVEVALDLHEELQSTIIATIADIEDSLAYATGAQLAHSLSQGSTAWDAYQDSKPGNNLEYRFIGKNHDFLTENDKSTYISTYQDYDDLKKLIENIHISLNDYKVTLHENRLELKEFKIKYEALSLDINAIKEQLRFSNTDRKQMSDRLNLFYIVLFLLVVIVFFVAISNVGLANYVNNLMSGI